MPIQMRGWDIICVNFEGEKKVWRACLFDNNGAIVQERTFGTRLEAEHFIKGQTS